MTKMTVIGCGYLGAVHAACMAQLGHDVVGIDVDAAKVALLAPGEPPFFEPGLRRGAAAGAGQRTAAFTSDMADAARRGRCTSSASAPRRSATSTPPTWPTSTLRSTALAPHLSAGDLVVGKSTVPVGTAARLADLVADGASRRRAGLEPGVPPRGIRGRGHPAPGPAGVRLPAGADGEPRRRRAGRGLRRRRWPRAPRWWSPTTRPPSW